MLAQWGAPQLSCGRLTMGGLLKGFVLSKSSAGALAFGVLANYSDTGTVGSPLLPQTNGTKMPHCV